ncbi:MAG: class 1 fructose-bisphosphatase [Candidatus Peribacteraceae bacterium]|jgi:fructose-1,6-bisphosphatase I|nr:fructose-bisphosphatase class I [bacterium]MDP6561322.1 class 1 fructose-bisphosphatase [Candidatus Peribacteraceae bacterium]|tara:strand:+ start:13471 stop:14427 length:957 start_codon:yes stop_codon:yes gene_type:complete
MSKASACPAPTKPNLNWHLMHHSEAEHDLRHLIVDISRACKYISYSIQTTEAGLAGTKNEFGEDQLALDVLADKEIREFLCESGLVCCYISEEQPDIVELNPDGEYSVVFDPLDGSSLVDANFAIGSIFGIYKGGDVIGATPREQVAALYVLYGPRTLLVYSVGDGKGVHEFILNDVGEFVLLRDYLGIGDVAKNYSPGNLRAITTNDGYKKAVDTWLGEEKTLRYSGCMVADIHHILSKGQGVFTNVGGGADSKYPDGKLRHVFECGPFAFLAEEAGGAATDGTTAILDKKITAVDQRTPLIIGSKNDVESVSSLVA